MARFDKVSVCDRNPGLFPRPVIIPTKQMKLKKILPALFIVTGLAVSSRAVVIASETGYLLDSKEAYFTARAGFDLKTDTAAAHQLALEVGYTQDHASGAKSSLLPVTLNYRFETAPGAGPFGYYAGVGAGVAHTRLEGVSINGPVTLSDDSFAAQAFAGVTYRITPAATLSLGAKYIWVDDVKLAGTKLDVGDDVALQAGFSFRF